MKFYRVSFSSLSDLSRYLWAASCLALSVTPAKCWAENLYRCNTNVSQEQCNRFLAPIGQRLMKPLELKQRAGTGHLDMIVNQQRITLGEGRIETILYGSQPISGLFVPYVLVKDFFDGKGPDYLLFRVIWTLPEYSGMQFRMIYKLGPKRKPYVENSMALLPIYEPGLVIDIHFTLQEINKPDDDDIAGIFQTLSMK